MRASWGRSGAAVLVTLSLMSFAPSVDATPQLRIAGAKPDGVKYQTTASTFEHDFSVVVDNGEKTVVSVEVPAFLGSAEPKNPEVTGDHNLTVTPTQGAKFHLKATLDHEGTYETDIELIEEKRRTFIPLTLVKTAPPEAALPPSKIEEVGPTTTEATRALPCRPVGGTLLLSVRNVAAVDQSVTAELTSMALKGAGGDTLQTDSIRANCNGAAMGQAPSGAAQQPDAPQGQPSPIKVAAGERAAVSCVMNGFRSAGRFEGVLRLSTVGYKPLDVPFVFLVKDSVWWAILWIGLGVGLSWLVRHYLSKERQKWLWARDISRLKDRLEVLGTKAQTDRVARIRSACAEEIVRLGKDLENGKTANLAADIATAAARLDLVYDIADLEARINVILEPQRTRLRTQLDDQVDALCTGTDPSKVAEALRLSVTATDREAIRDALTKTRATLDANRPALPPQLQEKLDKEATSPLDKAEESLASDDRSMARELLRQARLAMAHILAEGVVTELSLGVPAGVLEEDWKRLAAELRHPIERVRRAKDADSAVAAYEAVLDRYSNALTDAILSTLRGAVERNPDTKALFADMITRLEQAAASSSDTRLRVFRQVSAQYRAITGEPVERVVSAAASGLVGGQEVGLVGAISPRFVPDEFAPSAGTAKWNSKIRTADGSASLLLFLFSVLLGVKVLWVDNPTWGGGASWLVAFLWGLGLYAVGNVSFAGVVALREAYSKTS